MVKLKILLIEDSELEAKLVCDYLSSSDEYNVKTCASVKEAFIELLNNKFDIIILDLGLPDSSGLDTFNRIYSQYNNIPIIVLTGNDDEEQAVELVKRGAQDYLPKHYIDKKVLKRSIKYSLERFRIEEELRLGRSIYQALVENSPDMICRFSIDKTVIYANTRIMKTFGIKFDAKLDLYFINGNSFTRNHEFDHALTNIIQNENVVSLEANLTSIEGTGTFNIRLIPEKDNQSNLISILCIIQDITDRKSNEYEKQLLQEELHQAQKMEAIGQLAGGIAHDFNNMLAGIMGNAEILQSELSEENTNQEFINNIISISENASALTRQLLDFSRKSNFEYKVTDLHKLIKESVSILRNTIDRKINIETELNALWKNAKCDESHIKNAFINLGVNARDAMPEGGKLLIRTDNITVDENYFKGHISSISRGNYITISFIDTGTGISNEIKERIFEPFFTTKGPGLGTGLGLAGVYGCMQSHKGAVDVYSETGVGTEFKLYLPVSVDAENVNIQNRAIQRTEIRRNILLIDDELMIREMSTKMLKKLGYNVFSFPDIEQALDFYKAKFSMIDAVILDLIMPDKSGEEVFDELKRTNPEVKTIICSGFSHNDRMMYLKNKGAAGFVNKPFKAVDLSQTLENVFSARTS